METMSELFRVYKQAFRDAYEERILGEAATADVRRANEFARRAKKLQDEKDRRERRRKRRLGIVVPEPLPPGPIPGGSSVRYKAPKGMTYSSFARYMNRWVNDGKIERVTKGMSTELEPQMTAYIERAQEKLVRAQSVDARFRTKESTEAVQEAQAEIYRLQMAFQSLLNTEKDEVVTGPATVVLPEQGLALPVYYKLRT
jgi:hypothetical protein